jgi:peroxiredoxin
MTTVQRTNDAETLRRQFSRDAIWQRMVRPGDRVPSAVLLEADLGPIHLDRLRMTGAVVLVFVKYAGSAVCEATLERYERELRPATDAHVVAVSPQVPARLAGLKHRRDLSYFVAADPRHTLIDAFNLGFTEPGADLILGTGRSVLPFPAVVVAGRDGRVRYAAVRPDGSPHPDPSTILAALRPGGAVSEPARTRSPR